MLYCRSEFRGLAACLSFGGAVVKAKLRYVAVAVGVLLLFLIALPFFISVNSFRPEIEQHLSYALVAKSTSGSEFFDPFSWPFGR